MNYNIEQAKYIVGLFAKNSNISYDFSHMKYTIEFDLNEHFYKEFYNYETEYNKLINLILNVVEINIWHINNINISINNNELIFRKNDTILTNNDIFNIHEEDKKIVTQHIISRINETNAKSKKISNLIVEYNDIVITNEKIIKDINELKEMNKSLIGKFGILRLKTKNMFNFSSKLNTPNRDKINEDLYDIVKLIKSSESNYKDIIMNYFLKVKNNVENGYIYLFNYDKFEGSFSSEDLFLLNKIIDIINIIIDNTNDTISTNRLLINKQINELRNITEEIKNSSFITLISNLNNYNYSDLKKVDFKNIDYSTISPDNNLKYIIKMYENINYVNPK